LADIGLKFKTLHQRNLGVQESFLYGQMRWHPESCLQPFIPMNPGCAQQQQQQQHQHTQKNKKQKKTKNNCGILFFCVSLT